MKPRSILIALAITFVVYGVLSAYVPTRRALALVVAHGVIIGALCYAWCRADAIARGAIPPGRTVSLLAGLLPVVGVPVYLFRSRPRRAAWLGLAKALGLFVALSVGDALITEAIIAVRT
jgi:hypothetical protein